ncbi:MAG TPA: TIR domain-containing protein [Caulobacteraceae bacterium]|jgi:adenylate cyclase|nr:TIR domain-containing protein [Caulobacteraceae bacterium]
MADLFVSYARADRPRVAPLVAALEAEGWSVWWDPEIAPGQEFDRLIGEELGKARAAIVVWTPTSVASRWVRGEAREAADRGVLAPVRFENANLPLDLRAIHTTDLDGWGEDVACAPFRELVRAVKTLLGEAAPGAHPAAAAVRKLSICVLPFANLSDDPQQEYFSDGISEDIITDLSKVSALFVVARNTAFTLKGKSLEITQVARQFGVSHVLEGSVRKAGNRVRITAQLIDGATGGHVWAERYDRDLDDIFAMQDEISEAIVAALKLKLLPEEKKAIERRGTDNAEAYDLYLMARRYWKGKASNRRDLVIRLCRGAIDIDPKFAGAWALMAVCQSSKANNSATAGDEGWAAAEKALALDPDLAEAHAAKAQVLTYAGRMDEAQAAIDIALRLDPLSPDVNSAAGSLALQIRRFADAGRHFEAAAADDEDDYGAPFMAIQCHEALGDIEGSRAAAREALARVEKALPFDSDNGVLLGMGVCALICLGETDRAKTWARQALAIDPDDGMVPYNLACAMVRAGDVDYALDLLEQSLNRAGRGNLIWAQHDSDLDPLRQLPRYQAMMAAAEARFAAAEGAQPVA